MGIKSLIYFGMFVGSLAGGWIPTLWGASPLGFASVIGGLVGGFFGIWGAFKLGKAIGG